jgi:hypothetical protein
LLAGVDPDSDDESEEPDVGSGGAGDAEEAADGGKVSQMVASSPGPLLAQT